MCANSNVIFSNELLGWGKMMARSVRSSHWKSGCEQGLWSWHILVKIDLIKENLALGFTHFRNSISFLRPRKPTKTHIALAHIPVRNAADQKTSQANLHHLTPNPSRRQIFTRISTLNPTVSVVRVHPSASALSLRNYHSKRNGNYFPNLTYTLCFQFTCFGSKINPTLVLSSKEEFHSSRRSTAV